MKNSMTFFEMRSPFLFLFCLLSLPVLGQNVAQSPKSFGAKLMLFTENRGQIADMQGIPQPDILFSAQGGGVSIFLNKTGISYQFTHAIYEEKSKEEQDLGNKFDEHKVLETQTYRFDMHLEGTNPNYTLRKEEKNSYEENFYLAHCPNGITGVATYKKVVYENIYPYIDWVIYSTADKGLKYDFVVHPGGNPADIQIAYTDAESLNLDENGALTIATRLGKIVEDKPYTYQGKHSIESAFILQEKSLSFSIADYDKAENLVIDPQIAWATYYGGTGDDYTKFCTTDNLGNVYIVGYTQSTLGIASGGFQNTYGGGSFDAFLVKFDSLGNRLWATYYGGANNDAGYSCAADAAGNIYMTGSTDGALGISFGGFQNTNGGYSDAFLAKFNSAGIRIWASYYGGTGYDYGYVCATDALGNVYITGYTESTSGIASGGFQNTFGAGSDAFLVKFDGLGNRLWASYYGGTGEDGGYSCTTDASGNIYMTGYTQSTSGIASGGFQNTYGGGDNAFLVKFNASGNRLWATYYGGGSGEKGYSCATDATGNIYMTGYTQSTSGIASGGFQNTIGGGSDAFLVKFDGLGNRLWATYYGGTGGESGLSCVTDALGNVYIGGNTNSTSSIASGGFQNIIAGNNDNYLVKFDGLGNRLWATYYGGIGYDIGYACATDALGNVYMAGYTLSTSGIASGGFQNTFGGGSDAFLVKVKECPPTPTISIAVTNISCGQNPTLTVNATISNGGNSPSFVWKVNGNAVATTSVPTYTFSAFNYPNGAIITCQIIVTYPNGCNFQVASNALSINTYYPTLSAQANAICTGGVAQLSVSNGISSVYTWQQSTNGGGTWTNIAGYIGTSATTYTSAALSSNIMYRVISTNATCGTQTSNTVAMTIVANLSATISGNMPNVCYNSSSMVLSSTVTGGAGSITYQWQHYYNNTWVNISTSATYTTPLLTANRDYRVIVSASASGCSTATSNIYTVIVNPNPTITANSSNIILCPGGSTTLTASGASTYSWSPATGLSSTVGSTVVSTPSNSINYTVTGTSANGCTASTSVYVSVNTNPTVTITQNTSLHCYGTSATFTVQPYSYSAYTNPTFQWKKNGIAIAGATSSIYTTTTLHNNDVIVCEVGTNQACIPTITSNAITVLVAGEYSLLVPTVEVLYIESDCSNYGYLLANSTYASSYQWKKDGVNIAGATSNTLSPSSYGNYSCEISSNLACAVNTPILSDALGAGPSSLSGTSVYVTSNVLPGAEVCEGTPVNYTIDASYCDDCGCYYYQINEYDGANTPLYQDNGSYATPTSVTYSGGFTATPNSGDFGRYATILFEPCLFGAGTCGTYTASGGISVTVLPTNFTPTITIDTTNICGMVIFSAIATGGGSGATFQWKINGINVPDAILKQVVFNNLNNGDIVTCQMTSSLTCAATATVTSNAITVSISGQSTLSSTTPTICSGGAATIILNPGAGASTYTWQQSTNGGTSWYAVSGTNSTTTSIVATLTVTRLFRVIYNSQSCGTQTTPVFTLNVVPDPTVTITASNNNFCAGTSGTTLTATLNGGVGTGIYQWQQYIGANWTNIAGATSATYTTPTLSVSTNYKVISSQTGLGCVTTGANTVNIVVKALPTIYTSPASVSMCVGGTSTITAYNGTSYSWSPGTGLSATTGSPITATPAVTTTYSLTGLGTNGCSKTISVPVTVNQDPSVSISGDTTVCSGGSLTLISTPIGGAGTCYIQWQSSANGTTWASIAGATAATYTTPALTANTYYRVTYSCSGSGCSPAATSASLKVKIFNNVLGMVGSTPLCVGGSFKLLAPVMGGSYQCTWAWESSPNGSTWTAIPNVTTTYYYPPTTTAGSTYYRATVNCAGASCTNTPTAALLVTVNPDPSATISGQNSICGSGSTLLTLTPAGGAGTHSYQWQENIAGVFTNIAGATALTYTTPILTANKTYRVSHTATGSGCGTLNSAGYLVTILALPSVYTSPASASICVGGSRTITAYNGTSYSWTPATGLSATTGSPVTASPSTTTTYSLTGLGTNGCSKTVSVPITVTADPAISISGPASVPTGTSATLTASTTGGTGTCTRQWQSSANGSTWTNISGASAATYTTPAIVGTKYYRATYTCTGSGCSPAGTSNTLTIIGIQPPVRLGEKVYDLTLYPNPASVNLTVSLFASVDEKANFIITDMLGKTLTQWEGKSENGIYENEVSIENLSQGVYFLSVKIGERVMTQKFVKE